MAMIVWRVTPTIRANSACVISLRSNRRRRIWLLTLVGLTTYLQPPPIGDQLHHRTHQGRQRERHVDRVGDPEVIDLGDGEAERHEHREAQQDAADVLAETTDVAIPDVLSVALARPQDLDEDPPADAEDDGDADRRQEHRDVVDV